MFNNDSRFDIDLAYGQIHEQQVADILGKSKIEVKTERDIWRKTNNIAIEFSSRGKPSGIKTTKAKYWWHNLSVDGKIQCSIVLEVSTLIKYIIRTNPRVVRGGDDMTSELYLINLNDFFRNL
jgi:hypothetical protein